MERISAMPKTKANNTPTTMELIDIQRVVV
jgi:hypothetical protein